jgi:hypothetical protein
VLDAAGVTQRQAGVKGVISNLLMNRVDMSLVVSVPHRCI